MTATSSADAAFEPSPMPDDEAELRRELFESWDESLHKAGCKPEWKGFEKIESLCPAHNDSKPSLSSHMSEDKILAHCFTGCSIEDICGALGWQTSPLFVKKAPATTSSPKAPSSRPKEEPKPLPTEDDLRIGRDRLVSADIRMRLTAERDWSPTALTEFRLGLDANGRIEIPFYKGRRARQRRAVFALRDV